MQKLERNATQAGIIKAAAEEVPSLSTARGRPSRKYVLGYDGSEEQIQTPIVKDESGPSLRPRRENSTPISRTESHGLSSNQPASFFGFTSEQPCGSTGAAFSHAAKILKLSRIAQGRAASAVADVLEHNRRSTYDSVHGPGTSKIFMRFETISENFRSPPTPPSHGSLYSSYIKVSKSASSFRTRKNYDGNESSGLKLRLLTAALSFRDNDLENKSEQFRIGLCIQASLSVNQFLGAALRIPPLCSPVEFAASDHCIAHEHFFNTSEVINFADILRQLIHKTCRAERSHESKRAMLKAQTSPVNLNSEIDAFIQSLAPMVSEQLSTCTLFIQE
jgi:hypothetical protein